MGVVKKFALGFATFALLALATSAKADEGNKRTTLTVDVPIAVPGCVLPAGTYVIKIASTLGANENIVEIYNADETRLLTSVLAIPDYRDEVTSKSQFVFWKMPGSQVQALQAWFYPDDDYGQEFVYPEDMAAKIAHANDKPVPAVSGQNGNLTHGPVHQVNPK